MQWMMIAAASCLLGQATPNGPSRELPREMPQAGRPTAAAPVEVRNNSAAAELVATMFTSSTEARGSGRAVSLVEVLSTVHERSQQVAAAQVYWRLAAAVATFHVAIDDLGRIEQLAAQRPAAAPGSQPNAAADQATALLWQAQLAAAKARLSEAQVQLTAVQLDMSQRMGLAGQVLPVAADAPLVGAYNTYFEQLFGAGRPAPAEARLIDRLLPLRREAIELEAAAVRAAGDALDTLADGYARSATTGSAVVNGLVELFDRQQAFLEAVRRYNDEIAQYALPLAAEGSRPELLAAMLIKTQTPPQQGVPGAAPASTVEPPGTSTPATFNEPVRSGEPMPRVLPQAPPGAAPPTSMQPPGLPQPPRSFGPVEVRREPLGEASPHPLASDMAQAAPAEPVGLYSALIEHTPARQAQELATLLHWNRAGEQALGQPATLEECLSRSVASDHGAALHTYWRAARWAAQLQATEQTVEQLESLTPAVLRQRSTVAGSEAMLRLQAARLAAEAATVECRIELTTAQFELARRMGSPLDTAWPMPSTSPHGGGYRLSDEPAAVGAAAKETTARRWAEIVPQYHALVEESATAVVLADAARARSSAEYDRTAIDFDTALDTVERQAENTDSFLDGVARYNGAIADYVLATAPPQTPIQELCRMLVLQTGNDAR
ncbi:MAG TPA: hypothetical protein VHZ24_20290 [Pirellulales bacterium]|jgi:hypothetical protein|nr:hypothetical protein [Pirellulales bacterium]